MMALLPSSMETPNKVHPNATVGLGRNVNAHSELLLLVSVQEFLHTSSVVTLAALIHWQLGHCINLFQLNGVDICQTLSNLLPNCFVQFAKSLSNVVS